MAAKQKTNPDGDNYQGWTDRPSSSGRGRPHGSTRIEVGDGENKFSLTPQQVKVLTALIGAATLEEAGRNANVSMTSIYRWLREDEEFKRAYTEQLSAGLFAARHHMDGLMGKAAERLEQALDARDIQTCPSCKKDLICASCDQPVSMSNWSAVLKATEMLLKRQGELVNRTKFEGEMKHTVDALSHGERLGLEMVRAGNQSQVPDHVIDSLRAKGMIDEKALTTGDVVDAEVTVLD
jgi:hypothetical protein